MYWSSTKQLHDLSPLAAVISEATVQATCDLWIIFFWSANSKEFYSKTDICHTAYIFVALIFK
jgi:hypothetical protein